MITYACLPPDLRLLIAPQDRCLVPPGKSTLVEATWRLKYIPVHSRTGIETLEGSVHRQQSGSDTRGW